MKAIIKAEWRKSIRRPALLVGSALIGATVILVYGVLWYQALNPGSSEGPVSINTLYPDAFVKNVIGAGYPLGAALTIVLGAIIAGSEYSWGTLKTLLTQRPGRLVVWAGRTSVFLAWTATLTAILFGVGAASSVVVATVQGQAITWPVLLDITKGFAAVWLVFSVNGALGMALGVFLRQSAAALGAGIVYLLAVEILVVRNIVALNNGAYKQVGDFFLGQNAGALLRSFSHPVANSSISPEHAVLVLFVYLAALLGIAAALQRVRDVA